MQLLTVNAGDDLVRVLTTLEGEGWVQGSGHVEGVELKVPGEVTDVTRSLRGRLVLVSLQGPLAGPHTVTLSRATDVGLELIGGVLVRARAHGVTLALSTASPPAAPREPGPRREVVAVSSSSARSPREAPAPRDPSPASSSPAAATSTSASTSSSDSASGVASASTSPPRSPDPSRPMSPPRSWAEVAAASEEAASDESEENPNRGDLVDHFSFGLCEVIKADGDRVHLRDVKGPGRIREVVTSALKVMPPTTRSDGKRVFRLQRKV